MYGFAMFCDFAMFCNSGAMNSKSHRLRTLPQQKREEKNRKTITLCGDEGETLVAAHRMGRKARKPMQCVADRTDWAFPQFKCSGAAWLLPLTLRSDSDTDDSLDHNSFDFWQRRP